ncbi:glutathione S-transferase family protein [Flavimaricola marinus]|uniref:Glutathione S-transferase GST-6.0 n=1 Tax=Flavimaricola marinus TaxID=1819565 RepID=A0A238LKX7_9RHOB|nr:glutathione S-transferase N-terminal domain-containing protein [Flavimaricola marinus]SMY09520.1 Glutathione S-transferase GST-6.0 [Flavimaricola marinus]
MTLRLHYAPDNASLCIRLALEAGGFAYETALVDRRRHGHKAPAYLALNPNGLIPVLETPQGALFETGAILLWLADQRPGQMFPVPDAPDRGPALTWLFWMANTLHPTLRTCFYPHLYGSDPKDIRANALARLAAQLDLVEAAPQAYASTLARCYLAPLLRWAVIYAEAEPALDLARWPALRAMAAAFETTPAALAAARAEGLGPAPFSDPRLPNPPEGSAV